MRIGSFLQTIGRGDREGGRKAFRLALFQALQDGTLTDAEIADLEAKKAEYGLSDDDVRTAHLALYTAVFLTAKADAVVTEEEWKALEELQQALDLSDRDVAPSKRELLRLHILTEVKRGNLPIIVVPHLLLKKGEYPHWSEAASWLGETGKVVSDGVFIVTNKRLLFEGDEKSFVSSLKSILSVKVRGSELVLTESNRKPKTLSIADPANREILIALLTQLVQKAN